MISSMPFGKYRGQPLAFIPAGYLRWLLTREIDADLRQAAEAAVREHDAWKQELQPQLVEFLGDAIEAFRQRREEIQDQQSRLLEIPPQPAKQEYPD